MGQWLLQQLVGLPCTGQGVGTQTNLASSALLPSEHQQQWSIIIHRMDPTVSASMTGAHTCRCIMINAPVHIASDAWYVLACQGRPDESALPEKVSSLGEQPNQKSHQQQFEATGFAENKKS